MTAAAAAPFTPPRPYRSSPFASPSARPPLSPAKDASRSPVKSVRGRQLHFGDAKPVASAPSSAIYTAIRPEEATEARAAELQQLLETARAELDDLKKRASALQQLSTPPKQHSAVVLDERSRLVVLQVSDTSLRDFQTAIAFLQRTASSDSASSLSLCPQEEEAQGIRILSNNQWALSCLYEVRSSFCNLLLKGLASLSERFASRIACVAALFCPHLLPEQRVPQARARVLQLCQGANSKSSGAAQRRILVAPRRETARSSSS